MRGAERSRKNNGLRRRCPHCKCLRKYCEPPGDQGGEDHPRRVYWGKSPKDGALVCGWCVARESGLSTVTTEYGVVRDVKSGRVLSV